MVFKCRVRVSGINQVMGTCLKGNNLQFFAEVNFKNCVFITLKEMLQVTDPL